MAGPDYNMLLGVSQPDLIGIRDRANMAAQREIESQNQNALTSYLRQNGAAIMAGDQNALAGYAQFDPAAALGIQGTRQNMAQSREEFAMRKAEIARRTQAELEAKRNEIDQKALEAERAQLERALVGAGTFYSRGDREGYNRFLTSLGADPAQYPFESFEATAAQYQGVLDGIAKWQKAFQPEQVSPNERFKVVGSQLVDLGAEGGPSVVMTAPGQTETIYGPDGNPIVSRGPALQGKLTEGQSKDVGFAARARGALGLFDPVSDSLANPVWRALEVVGGYDPTGYARGMQSGDFQMAYQAGNEFLAAILRKDTGAAVTPEEQNYYGKIYLPQPGDGDEVLLQKKLARERAISALEAGMPANAIAAQEEALRRTNQSQGGHTRRRFNPATGAFE